jgi:hypothetical protein
LSPDDRLPESGHGRLLASTSSPRVVTALGRGVHSIIVGCISGNKTALDDLRGSSPRNVGGPADVPSASRGTVGSTHRLAPSAGDEGRRRQCPLDCDRLHKRASFLRGHRFGAEPTSTGPRPTSSYWRRSRRSMHQAPAARRGVPQRWRVVVSTGWHFRSRGSLGRCAIGRRQVQLVTAIDQE